MIKIPTELIVFMPLAMGIGVAMATQTAINAQLRDYLHSPIQAAFISFLVGTLILGVFTLIQQPKFSLDELSRIPWYLWLGGCLGVYAISMSIYTAPKLGLLSLTALIIFAQIAMSMLYDHFAWFGGERIPIDWRRVLGALTIFVGVILTLQR